MPTYDKVELNKMNYGIVLNDFVNDSNKTIDLGDWTLVKATKDEIDEFRIEL